jgi:PAS domain-containing protein
MDYDRKIFFERHPDPMWICDLATRRFLDVNEAAILKYGYPREDFLQM